MQNPSSSPASDCTRQSSRSTVSSTSLAFLVHSPDTVEKNLPPDVDNKPLARQKRRRTSKEDEDILKTEYSRNPKPDKAARMQIVSRVALSEKEVQIWFQNRRQSDRRRSRPSETFDILPSSQGSDASNIAESFDDSEDRPNQNVTTTTESAQTSRSEGSQTPVIAPPALSTSNSSLAEKMWDATSTASQSFTSSQGSSTYTGSQPGYLANRRCASFSKNGEDEQPDNLNIVVEDSWAQRGTKSLKRSLSFVRLSMTVEGNAKVITEADGSPSPPRPQPNPGACPKSESSLRRSHSAVGANDKLLNTSLYNAMPPMRRGVLGRSRDSRAWEFWCDSDARNSLTEKADQEGSGSAADAIGLIRASARVPLKSIPNKRNASSVRQNHAKRTKADMQKKSRPTLQRAKTSLGRLQSKNDGGDGTAVEIVGDKTKGYDDAAEFETVSTESDKENRDPTDQGSSRRKVADSSKAFQSSRRILGENTTVLSQSSSLGEMLAREKRKKDSQSQASSDTRGREESAELTNTGNYNHIRHASTSSGEELGCAEGLLALSQGNWR